MGSQAMFLSITTLSTIGFGLKGEAFMNAGCAGGVTILALSSLAQVFLDAVALGVIIARIGRGQTRASTLCFSNKALLKVSLVPW